MGHPTSKDEILDALGSNAETIAAFFSEVPENALFTGNPERWGPAHHLVHLTMTSHAIQRGLGIQGLPPHPTGRSRGYAELIGAASTAVGAAPRELLLERGRVVTVPPAANREALLNGYLLASAKLRAAAETLSEEDLDRRAMPHPYIGVLTLREMLLFCVFHERHHLKLARAHAGRPGSSS